MHIINVDYRFKVYYSPLAASQTGGRYCVMVEFGKSVPAAVENKYFK